MKKIAVFCSGFGSNLQAIINAVKRGGVKADIAFVLTDKVDAPALVRARKAGIPFMYVDPDDFKDRLAYDKYVAGQLKKRNIDFVVLAGFLRIISPYFVRKFKNKIINVHPALLPSFKGVHGIRDAINYGVKVTGVTVHFVEEELDAGPVILQKAVNVRDDDTQDSLAQRIHKVEHMLYPLAVKLLVENRITVKGRKVRIK
ncbi:MAG: phosphoribosylglycinamide formyltransferase [Candidatus Omnitrophica bacterium]|nr:phosphoribosylglycinamide formyltransferase [Candidatus Omnitrophota bacterium]MBU4479051.1 phosphoribosylglycinamide formyltransferase [Candidatus Omnitrophota bacterium]MCG2702758.1 phosphoribosylglycinamide formyltransferase [Candidatus Omnitrophota bacterium]